MLNPDKQLAGKTLVFTGSNAPVEAIELARLHGAETAHIPLIETKSIVDREPPELSSYDWLIFTSRMGAEVFGDLGLKTTARIAAVGERTAEALAAYGLHADFIPTRYSADTFVVEFPSLAGDSKCLFVKGALAKNTIASMELPVDEWVVYDTVPVCDNARKLKELSGAIVIFASPSAVEVFCDGGGDWEGIETAAIGHITEQAVVHHGGKPAFVPVKYTYEEVVREIVKGCSEHE